MTTLDYVELIYRKFGLDGVCYWMHCLSIPHDPQGCYFCERKDA